MVLFKVLCIPILFLCIINSSQGEYSCSSFFGFYDDPNDIKGGFYLCVFGFSIHGSCNDSLMFYPKKCVGWNPNQPTINRNFKCPWVDGKYPDIDDTTCKGYWECLAQNATYNECGPDESFYPNLEVCSKTAICDGYSYKCEKQFSIIPDPNDKTKYYECYYGLPYHWPCDPGLIFDVENNYCDLLP